YKITPCSVGQILMPCLKNVRDLALLQALTCNSDTFTGKSPEYADKTAGILRSRKTNVLSL
ncbi:hypothetical protein ACK306_19400, partial [Aeromonas caviae]